MLHEVILATVHRIMNDKILLGLVIVGVLGFFMAVNQKGQITEGDRDRVVVSEQRSVQANNNSAKVDDGGAGGNSDAGSGSGGIYKEEKLDPALATDFVKWWLGSAMDYQPQSAMQSHQEAFNWATEDVSTAFKQAFWSNEFAQALGQGAVTAAFQPSSVTAQAVNPDGTVVVSVIGTLIVHSNGQPSTSQVLCDFLVRKEEKGLRIAGMYNRTFVASSAAPEVSGQGRPGVVY